jgi:hypothetical protein
MFLKIYAPISSWDFIPSSQAHRPTRHTQIYEKREKSHVKKINGRTTIFVEQKHQIQKNSMAKLRRKNQNMGEEY